MASRQTYECYVCKKNGFADTRVYLDGKTPEGKTIYKNEDLSPHTHKQQEQSQAQQSQGSKTIVTQSTKEERILILLNDLNTKMNHVIKLLEEKK